jgi:hypothetical protein
MKETTMSTPFRIEIKDWRKAQELKEHVDLGHRFVFVRDSSALKSTGRLGRLLGFRQDAQRTVLPLVDAPVELTGVDVVPEIQKPRPLACLVSDRDLYRREEDTVHLYAAMPKPGRDVRLVITQNGVPFTERPLSFGPDGVAVEALSMLLAGRYEAMLADSNGPYEAKAAFTVADYSLAPLSARLSMHRVDRGASRLSFDLSVESYQVPFARSIVAALIDRDREVDQRTITPSAPGRFSGELKMDGEGPFRIRIAAPDDPSLIAEVVIPGSRKHEREVTLINELGREIYFSLMPEAGAIPVRGGYLTEGDHIATPLSVDEVLTDQGRIRVNLAIESLVLIVVDIASGTSEVVRVGDAAAGQLVDVPIHGPMASVFAGCFIDGRPFEGFTSFIKRSKLAIEVDAPKTARPSESVEIRVRVKGATGEVPCLVSIRDERLTAVDTPCTALAASAKRTFATLAAVMDDDVAFRPLAPEMIMPVPPMGAAFGGMVLGAMPAPSAAPRAPGNRPRNEALAEARSDTQARGRTLTGGGPGLMQTMKAIARASAPPPSTRAMTLDEGAALESSIHDALAKSEIDDESRDPRPAQEEAPEARGRFPEVLFFGLVPVKGEETILVPVKDALTTYAIEVFALSAGDWSDAKTTLTIDQPVRVDLDVPPAVAAEDRVLGKLRAASAGGRVQIRLACGGEVVELTGPKGQIVRADDLLDSPAELAFFVRPGTWVAEVKDAATGEIDRVEALVGTPGKFKSYVRQLAIVEPGARLTLDSEDAVALRIVPALDEPFGMLVEATAGYEHLCCEQTGAKILSAAAMYVSAKTPNKRTFAEEIILAGVVREASMWKRGRGFSMYPGHAHIAEHYGPKIVHYLWSLQALADLSGISTALRRCVSQALEMADDVARALRMARLPAKIASFEDAYAIATSKDRKRAAEVRAYLAESLDLEAGDLKKNAKVDPVTRRFQLAYGAACLLAIGETARAIRMANLVTRQFNEAGRLYSTIDSVAAIGLLAQLEAAGIGTGKGRVKVNGRTISTSEAGPERDQIEEIEVLEGMALVEITRIREEDWTSFSNDLEVTIGFRDRADRKVNRFRPGDRAELLVQLGRGYKFGDLVHVSLPASLSWIQGGGRVKRFTVDFEGKDELRVPLVVTGAIQGREHFAVCVRNMFEEARVTSPGTLSVNAA